MESNNENHRDTAADTVLAVAEDLSIGALARAAANTDVPDDGQLKVSAGRPQWLPADPRERGIQKLDLVLRWLCLFHYSNVAVLMDLLGLKHFTNSSYFKRLADRNLVKRVDVESLRRPVYMLTATGLAILEGVPEVAQYHLDDRRIAPSLARHTLAVQRAVLRRRSEWVSVIPERLIRQRGKKVPDAILRGVNFATALEVELTYKTRMKIYLGFVDHARALRDKKYERVVYVFKDKVMRDAYQRDFDERKWPVYRWNEKSRHYDLDKEMFMPDSFSGLRESISFVVEDLSND